MINEKVHQLKQDLEEVKAKLEEVTTDSVDLGDKVENFIVGRGELIEAFGILEEHLKEHIEDVEIFLGRTC